MKRYLCILFLLFDCFIFRGDYVSAFGADRLMEAVYIGAGDFSTAYAYDANGNMTRDLNKGISNISYNLLTCREKLHSPMAGRSNISTQPMEQRFAQHIMMQQAARRCKSTIWATISSATAL